ncbi:hypothetical protein FK268_12900 [Tsukamurella sputi]|uniref:Cellulose biosynthesis cyclic di-GMP-binding regulatory protein BcsB n=1 Tax=Tsukamurella sputi TaxID=2591848 RepID=A0A5C5RKH7_9ACTN|nr:hypothetical protein [Tsukamurella sputi]TWS23210.1 hypothetical protein FK268_12900 [Tsukamurella sputi]
MNRSRVRAFVAAAIVLTQFAAVAPAHADPDTGAVVLPLAATGDSGTVVLPGLQATRTLAVPTPRGALPAELRARVTAPPFVSSVTVDVLQEGRTLSRTVVPRPAANAPIVLPLTGIRPQQVSTTVTLRTWLQADGQCLFDDADALRLTDTSVGYAGAPAQPTTAADFLPPVLSRVSLLLPARPTREEGAAAVRLAAALSAHYPGAPLTVTTGAIPVGGAAGTTSPFERQIVISGTEPRSFQLRTGASGTYAVLGGSADDLTRTAALLTSDLAPLAASSGVLVEQPVAAPQLPRVMGTLDELGIGTLTATALYRPTVTVGIDQTQLGGPVRDVRVRLAGTYSPGTTGEAGRVVVSAGDRTLASWPADATGTFDRWVDVPNDLLARYTALTVALDRPVARGGCGEGGAATLSVDGSSEIRRATASPPAPSGFQSLPQALMPRMQVAWTRGDLPDVRRAVAVVSALGRMARAPLGVDVVDADEAVRSRVPALFIDADGARSADLPLRVRAGSGGTIEAARPDGAKVVLRLDPQLRAASLQVIADADRTLVVATSNGEPGLLDAELDWLAADPTRWPTRTGDVLLQTPNAEPVQLNTAPPAAARSSSDRGWVAAAAAAGAVAVLLAVAAAVVLVRRRRRG